MYPVNLETYREMLEVVSTRHQSIKYSEIANHQEFVLWRHDCDMSLNRALQIANIDAHYGVQSTFFVNPHSEFYNIFEKKQTGFINAIRDLGHQIGLHLDAAYHQHDDGNFNIEVAILKDVATINMVTDAQIEVFSFHNPSSEILQLDNDHYAGLVNCYSKTLFRTVGYGSDSNGYWRHQPIPELLMDANKTRLQILTHPEWWLETDSLPRNRVLRCVYGRAIKVMTDYDQTMSMFKDRENIMDTKSQIGDFERATDLL
jgi:hypothetical protein